MPWAFTVTEMLCVALKLPSLAVTVIVALPRCHWRDAYRKNSTH